MRKRGRPSSSSTRLRSRENGSAAVRFQRGAERLVPFGCKSTRFLFLRQGRDNREILEKRSLVSCTMMDRRESSELCLCTSNHGHNPQGGLQSGRKLRATSGAPLAQRKQGHVRRAYHEVQSCSTSTTAP
ncbi:hypothetical protein BS78_10G198000 [Paspalum vaginatum]|nr:hypothetical protein BS78_10G198000 [Paspalum vaginatum]